MRQQPSRRTIQRILSPNLLLTGGMVLFVIALAYMGASARDQLNPAPLAALPAVPGPSDDPLTPAKITLGKLLYFDPRLSGDGSLSCASCHDPKLGWGDGGDLSRGYPGTLHWRNSQTILNAAYLDRFFWTGSSPDLPAQAKAAITGPLAQNMNPALMEERLKQIPAYVGLFQQTYGGPPTFENALRAISAFERTIVSKNVPFDRYMKGDKMALTPLQVKGLTLFEGKAGCVQCHNGPLFTDQKLYNLGVPKNPAFDQDPQRQIAMRERMRAKGIHEAVIRALDRDPGHYLDTKREEDKGSFRTAPLRELRYTAPYMHNGVFFSLEEVIHFYDRGGGDDPFGTKSSLIRPLQLTAEEKAALVAFLESLSGDQILVDTPELPEYEVLPLPFAGAVR
ncbi:MAG: cytochrome-c peroxidase [candidate division NC10 bacterium]|nr:cytochrome-c peroxidase [candidate division NC10 bacterium]